MLPVYLGDAKFWRLLFQIDEDLADVARADGCPHCAGVLHGANYPRKARGLSHALLGERYEYRLSLCCAREGCRRRTTPVSVRFLGRRVYLATLVVLVTALAHGLGGTARAQLCTQFGIAPRTLRRWQRWWHEVFPATRWWRGARGRFMPVLEAHELPGVLFERFAAAEPAKQMCEVLTFLAPLSVGAGQVI